MRHSRLTKMEELFQWVAVGTLALRPSQMFSNFIGVGFFFGGGRGAMFQLLTLKFPVLLSVEF